MFKFPSWVSPFLFGWVLGFAMCTIWLFHEFGAFK